ncbi:MAG: NAD(P)/FAD-dependent oxidoreductase [Chloroflexi bacterium]|nr:NAD(P)/FAD-dependent oxidoreductase [Chloroflexota bacterium]
MNNSYSAIIIGAGHNGLVAAAYLARQGKKVLVLERRAIVGGSVVTESFGDGFTADSVFTGGSLRHDIVKDLKLSLPEVKEKPAFISLQPNGNHLTLDAESIKRISEKDAARFPEFVRFMNKAAQIMDVTYATIMPRLPMNFGIKEGYGLLEWALELKLAGRKDMLNFIRALPMTVQELVEEYFESEVVKAAICAVAIHGSTLGPMGAGTGYTLIHNWMNRGGLAHKNVGKAGEITTALANAVKAFGGEIRTEAEVTSIRVEAQVAKGVVLANGEEISANVILSAADPKHTLLKLVGPRELPPEFVWHTQSIKMRGSVAKIHLLLDDVGTGLAPVHAQGRPHTPSGHIGSPQQLPQPTIVLAPSIKYLEKAYDAAKYGEISEKPYLEITTSGNTVSIHFQFAPYNLKNGSWNMENGRVEKLAIDTLAEYFPNLKSSIVNRKLITPLDLEQTYGLTEGDLNHGQLMLDQFLFMRPIPGWSNHKTPIDNLYLCGSGVHGGGGVSGAAGRNAANALN